MIDSAAGNGTVEEIVTFEDAKLEFGNEKTFDLVLDQGAVVGDADYAEKGITVTGLELKFIIEQDAYDYHSGNGYDTVKFTCEIEDNEGLADYVTVTAEDIALAVVEGGTEVTVNFAWTELKPTTEAEYEAMLTALSCAAKDENGKSAFTFTLKVTAELAVAEAEELPEVPEVPAE